MKKTPIKICGITRLEDAELAAELGAWALGFVFHEKSPRYIPPRKAREIALHFANRRIKLVGVFVNAPADDVLRIARDAELTTVQLHGDESVEFCRDLGLEVIKAFRPAKAEDLTALEAYKPLERLAGLLIDAPAKGDGPRGGTGRLSDWVLARAARAHGPVILSGGLRPENVADAIRAVEPFALDVSSGVEESLGKKSHAKLTSFFQGAGYES